MDEREYYNGQFRNGDRVYVNRPLKDIVIAEETATISIVLDALAIFFSTMVFGFVLGIFAIKNSRKSKYILNSRHHKYHVATAGEICGWVSIGVSAFFLILYLIIWIIPLIIILVLS